MKSIKGKKKQLKFLMYLFILFYNTFLFCYYKFLDFIYIISFKIPLLYLMKYYNFGHIKFKCIQKIINIKKKKCIYIARLSLNYQKRMHNIYTKVCKDVIIKNCKKLNYGSIFKIFFLIKHLYSFLPKLRYNIKIII